MAEKKSKKVIKEPKVVNRIKTFYDTEAVQALMKRFNYKSVMEVPKLNKIVLNMRLGDIKDNAKSLQSAVRELELIAGQKAVVCNAKMSVANFKLRTGMPVGAKVTLRSDKMWHFLEKLVAVALPRVRDFRGLSVNSFDGRGNYSLGIKEQLVFPEIIYDNIEKVRGFDISIITTAKTDEEAKELLTLLGMPFARR